MNVKKTVKELHELQVVNWETHKLLSRIESALDAANNRVHAFDQAIADLINALENDGK